MRVEQPDPVLVAEAITAAASWTGGDPVADWRVGDTVSLKNSTIHFIDLNRSTVSTRLVYKIKTSSSGRSWFDHNPALTNLAVPILRAEGLDGTPVLAFDADRLIVVTLYVDGAQLRPVKSSNLRLDEGSRQVFRRVGRGASILESVVPPVADGEVEDRLWQDFAERLANVSMSSVLRDGVEAMARSSFERATETAQPLHMGHSDLTFGNVVVDEGVPAFIDLTFALGLRGMALAKLLHRLEFTTQVASPGIREAIAAVKAGYGAEPEGMGFLRADRIVRMLGPSRALTARASVRRRRALRAMRQMISSDV